jgi:hypothetical protein
MTAMEIRINLHRISDQEIDTLCASAGQYYAPEEEEEERQSARVISFPRRGRYT